MGSVTGEPSGEALRASVGDGNPELYPGSVNEVAFSADGRWLLAAVGAGGHGEVVAWSLAVAHAPAPLPRRHAAGRTPSRSPPTAVPWPASERTARCASSISGRGKPLSGFLEGHGGPTTSAAFSPDGRMLATAGSDGSPILWDVRTRKQLGAPLPGPSQGTRMHVAFTPDGRHLIAQYFDGQTWEWDVDPASWRDRACTVAGRNLTKDEWDKFLPGPPLPPYVRAVAGGHLMAVVNAPSTSVSVPWRSRG